jgi:hypothetical protein
MHDCADGLCFNLDTPAVTNVITGGIGNATVKSLLAVDAFARSTF